MLSGQPTLRTLAACGPLGPSCTSYSTFWPSARLRNPSDWMAVWWTNTSLPPASGVMNPKPFASLNHFTVPLGILHSPAQNGAVVWWVTYAAPAPAPSGPGLRSLPQDTGGGPHPLRILPRFRDRCLPERPLHRIELRGLHQEGVISGRKCPLAIARLSIAREGDEPDACSQRRADRAGHLEAIVAGQSQVDHHGVRPAGHRPLDGSAPVGAGFDVVTHLLESDLQQVPGIGIVLGDHDVQRPRPAVHLDACLRRRQRIARVRHRQADDELAPFPKAGAARLHPTPVQLDEALHEREADAHSTRSTVERAGCLNEQVEDPRQHLRADPHAGILHPEHRLAGSRLDAHLDPSARVGVLHGIGEKIRDDLLQAQQVAAHHHRSFAQRVDDLHALDLRGPLEPLDRPVHHGTEVDAFLLQGDLAAGHPRYVQQIVHQPGEMAELPAHHRAFMGESVARLPVDQLRGGEDRGQRVAQLMSQHGEELIAVADRALQGREQVPDLVLAAPRAERRTHRAQERAHANGTVEQGHVGCVPSRSLATAEDDQRKVRPGRLPPELLGESRRRRGKERFLGEHCRTGALGDPFAELPDVKARQRLETVGAEGPLRELAVPAQRRENQDALAGHSTPGRKRGTPVSTPCMLERRAPTRTPLASMPSSRMSMACFPSRRLITETALRTSPCASKKRSSTTVSARKLTSTGEVICPIIPACASVRMVSTPRCRRYESSSWRWTMRNCSSGIAARKPFRLSMTRTRVPRASTSSRIEPTISPGDISAGSICWTRSRSDAISSAARIPSASARAVSVWMLSSKA